MRSTARRVRARFALLFPLALLPACSGQIADPLPAAASVPAEAADLHGVIEEVEPRAGYRVSFRVGADPERGRTAPYVVHLSDSTRILLRGTDGAVREAAIGALRTGAVVDVWTTGVELRSYPAQVFATAVLLRPES